MSRPRQWQMSSWVPEAPSWVQRVKNPRTNAAATGRTEAQAPSQQKSNTGPTREARLGAGSYQDLPRPSPSLPGLQGPLRA